MLNKSQIIKEFKKKVNKLKKYNDLYFNQDNPSISDSEYDLLKVELIDLEKKYLFIEKLNLLSNLVGSPPKNKFKKFSHLKPMLSLSNAFEKSDMLDFMKKVNNFLNTNKKEIELFSEPKIDGISATLIYEKGTLIRGLSRGDGVIGEDILNNIKTIRTIPKTINNKDVPQLLEIRCEIFIGKKDFLKIKISLQTQETRQVGLLDKKTLEKQRKFHSNILLMGLGQLNQWLLKNNQNF